jgi:hypothetical protein
MAPGDLNRIEGAFADAAIDCGLRSRALNTTGRVGDHPGVAGLFRIGNVGGSALLSANARLFARASLPSDKRPSRREHVNSQD